MHKYNIYIYIHTHILCYSIYLNNIYTHIYISICVNIHIYIYISCMQLFVVICMFRIDLYTISLYRDV